MSIYPQRIKERSRQPGHIGRSDGVNAVGMSATFVCGSFVRFSLRIDAGSKVVASAKFQTNGCGFMTAAADVIAEGIEGKQLGELHGLEANWLRTLMETELEPFDCGRIHCSEACFEAIQGAFSDYRVLQLEEFQGEKALICTCFGVAEETIERVIAAAANPSVELVGEVCRAGSGCGSCRMLIQELIDQQKHCPAVTG